MWRGLFVSTDRRSLRVITRPWQWYRERRRLTPQRPQFQTTGCSIGALQSILADFGSHAPAKMLRQVTAISRHCTNARDILAGARHFGLQAKALKRSPGELATVRLLRSCMSDTSVLSDLAPTNDLATGG
jgi:hypothetical protein